MCDETTERENDLHLGLESPVSRRRFGHIAGAGGLSLLLPEAAGAAVPVTEADVTIKTADGTADAYFVHPAKGRSPGVLIWPDIRGLRPAFRQMGKRLAEAGYAVLVINPFYRSMQAPVVQPGEDYADPKIRERIAPMAKLLSARTVETDAAAFVAFLDKQKAVDPRRKLATTGYCMGGPMTMRTAASHPKRIGAAASFHGGGLATREPDSPHLLVPQMKASYLFAIAENDDQRDPQAKELLRQAFDAAKLPAEIEVYAGAMHGWCTIDSRVYNEAQAERAWGKMLALFKTAL